MIGKAKSNNSLSATIDYNDKEDTSLIYCNKMEGENLKDFYQQMNDLQKCYQGYSKKLVIHAILSPAIEDSSKLTQPQWQQVAYRYLKEMKLEKHQVVGFLHTDKQHKHLHLIINKVNPSTYKLYHDNFIWKKSQHAADRVAAQLGLVRAKLVMQQKCLALQAQKDANELGIITAPVNKPIGSKQLFKTSIENILQKNIKDINHFFELLKQQGFTVHLYYQKGSTELRGYGVEKNGTKLDASAISKHITLKAIIDKLQKGNKSNIAPVESLEPIISFNKNKQQTLINFLKDNNIDANIIKTENFTLYQTHKNYYWGIKTDSNSLALYNPYSIAYSGKLDITTITNTSSKQVIIVENYIQYLKLKSNNANLQATIIILHTLKNMDKAIAKVKQLNPLHINLQISTEHVANYLCEKLAIIDTSIQNLQANSTNNTTQRQKTIKQNQLER